MDSGARYPESESFWLKRLSAAVADGGDVDWREQSRVPAEAADRDLVDICHDSRCARFTGPWTRLRSSVFNAVTNAATGRRLLGVGNFTLRDLS